jgi:hypothetical protein
MGWDGRTEAGGGVRCPRSERMPDARHGSTGHWVSCIQEKEGERRGEREEENCV